MSAEREPGGRIVVGVADCRVSSDPSAVLTTYGLGSCIAVTIYDPTVRVGGLLHFMFPDSRLDQQRARENPCAFADTGLRRLVRESYSVGARKHRLQVAIAGGARTTERRAEPGDVGARNIAAVKRVLKRAGLRVYCEATGGGRPREVRLDVANGRVEIK